MAGNWDEKKVRSVFIDKYLVKLEKKAFGWHLADEYSEIYGTQTEVSVTDSGIYSTTTPLSEKYMLFIRPKNYAKGFFFRFFEFLNNFIAFFRRVGIVLFLPIAVFMGIMYILCLTACKDPGTLAVLQETAPIIGIVYAILIVPPIIITLLGYMVRKLKKLDDNY